MVAWFQPSTAADVMDLIEQLCNPGGFYPLPGDDKGRSVGEHARRSQGHSREIARRPELLN
jgi:hypothetical protein